MRACSVALLLGALFVATISDSESRDKPYGLERRFPWTTSKVVGSPDPPLPYHVKQIFPKL